MHSRIAVLASGGGSNLQAVLDYFDVLGDRRAGEVVLVASNRDDAGALARATRREIATAVLASGAPAELDEVLTANAIDLVVLAGYVRLVPTEIVAKYEGRIVNIHPALLPAFGGPGMYGQRVHRAVIESGARVSGATVHFVNESYDRGRIIAQWPVPVFASDDPGTLAARVLRVEHLLYPRVVQGVAGGRFTLQNCVAAGMEFVDSRPAFTLLSHEDSRLAENIELALGC
ncbi:MAG TPA: phosphoribosylglycinamide formyltransferase [Gemmatimonadaceae bacterium]|jgi:phosphoribosylglycinamide formyltransferase 1|nr:phosphoribosylglycinamide formyltransferase [Gemmatimonadaceae bacterium]